LVNEPDDSGNATGELRRKLLFVKRRHTTSQSHHTVARFDLQRAEAGPMTGGKKRGYTAGKIQIAWINFRLRSNYTGRI